MNKISKEKEKNEILLKHNTLVTARYNLTVEESRIFIYMLYKIQRNISVNGMFCTISQDEFKKLVPNKNKNSIKGITKILASLADNKIYFKKEKSSQGSIWGHYNFLSGFEYDDELKEFTVECSTRVYSILMEHDYEKDGYYTPVNLIIWLQLKNQNTQRLYDFMRLWTNSQTVITYEIEELKELMMLEDKYSKYSDFKKRVLNPSVEELNKTGYFKIETKENKKNKKVVSIDFLVEDLDKRVYFKEKATEKEILETVVNITGSKCDKSGIEKENKFYIPDKKVFTVGTLRSFKIDFEDIDFKNEYMLEAFNDSIAITFEKDDVEKIKVANYKLFKNTLINKIEEYREREIKDLQHQEEMAKYWQKLPVVFSILNVLSYESKFYLTFFQLR